MKFKKGPIEGVLIQPLKPHRDDRGWLGELFRADELSKEIAPVMAYASFTHPGVQRGPHEHENQTDYFCFFGPSNFRIVLWDNRKNSPTYLNKMSETVGADRPAVVIVPPGVVHTYKNVGTVEGLVVNCPNKLYGGYGRKEKVDEIRHEGDPDTPFRLEEDLPLTPSFVRRGNLKKPPLLTKEGAGERSCSAKHPRLGLQSLISRRRGLRKEATRAEAILWKELRGKRLRSIKFKRQHGIGPYIVDFCAPREKLVIEIDGDIHALPDQMEMDEMRTREIESLGFQVIRYQNDEIFKNLQSVLEDILNHIKTSSPPQGKTSPYPPPL